MCLVIKCDDLSLSHISVDVKKNLAGILEKRRSGDIKRYINRYNHL